MNLYRVTLIFDDVVMDEVFINAMSIEGAEERVNNKKDKRFKYERYVIQQVACNCGSYDDVAYFFINGKAVVECKQCRFDNLILDQVK